MLADGFGPEWDERANERWREAEVRNAVPRDERPQPVGRRVVRRAFVEYDRRAERQPAENRPRSHHPAHVREPEEHFARA